MDASCVLPSRLIVCVYLFVRACVFVCVVLCFEVVLLCGQAVWYLCFVCECCVECVVVCVCVVVVCVRCCCCVLLL